MTREQTVCNTILYYARICADNVELSEQYRTSSPQGRRTLREKLDVYGAFFGVLAERRNAAMRAAAWLATRCGYDRESFYDLGLDADEVSSVLGR